MQNGIVTYVGAYGNPEYINVSKYLDLSGSQSAATSSAPPATPAQAVQKTATAVPAAQQTRSTQLLATKQAGSSSSQKTISPKPGQTASEQSRNTAPSGIGVEPALKLQGGPKPLAVDVRSKISSNAAISAETGLQNKNAALQRPPTKAAGLEDERSLLSETAATKAKPEASIPQTSRELTTSVTGSITSFDHNPVSIQQATQREAANANTPSKVSTLRQPPPKEATLKFNRANLSEAPAQTQAKLNAVVPITKGRAVSLTSSQQLHSHQIVLQPSATRAYVEALPKAVPSSSASDRTGTSGIYAKACCGASTYATVQVRPDGNRHSLLSKSPGAQVYAVPQPNAFKTLQAPTYKAPQMHPIPGMPAHQPPSVHHPSLPLIYQPPILPYHPRPLPTYQPPILAYHPAPLSINQAPLVYHPAPQPIYQPAPEYHPVPNFEPGPIYHPQPSYQPPPAYRPPQPSYRPPPVFHR
jgi:hypothetical protein